MASPLETLHNQQRPHRNFHVQNKNLTKHNNRSSIYPFKKQDNNKGTRLNYPKRGKISCYRRKLQWETPTMEQSKHKRQWNHHQKLRRNQKLLDFTQPHTRADNQTLDSNIDIFLPNISYPHKITDNQQTTSLPIIFLSIVNYDPNQKHKIPKENRCNSAKINQNVNSMEVDIQIKKLQHVTQTPYRIETCITNISNSTSITNTFLQNLIKDRNRYSRKYK